MNSITSIFSLSIFLLASVIGHAQAILVVDNNPTAPTGDHVYSDLQTAIDAASEGDILHVIPSPTDYGTCTLNKNIQVYGIGYTPDTETQFTSRITHMAVDAGASGALVSGIHFTQGTGFAVIFDNSTDTLSGFTLDACRLSGLRDTGTEHIEDITIQNNIFTGFYVTNNQFGVIHLNTAQGATHNVVISGNIFTTETFWQTYSKSIIEASNFTVISNNLFSGTGAWNMYAFRILTDCFVANNVFHGINPGSFTTASFYGNTFINNLSFGADNTTLPPVGAGGVNDGSGNLQDVDPMLTDVGFNLQWDFENNPEPLAGSPLIGAGSDGTDIGLGGGNTPYAFGGGGTPLPYIHYLGTNGLIIEGQDIQVTATARSNK